MAFTIDDLGDLLALLRTHPEWREAVRREVLTDELLGLPEAVRRLVDAQGQLAVEIRDLNRRLTEAQEQLAAEIRDLNRRLTEVHEQLAAEIRELSRVVRRLDGRLGNLEGWRY